MIVWPISVEPVNPSFLTRPWSAIACPHILPVPGSTLITPGGNPASTVSSANCKAGSHLPGEHHQGVVPGGHQPTDSNRIFASDGKVSVGRGGVVDWNGASLNFVTPSSKVSPGCNGHPDMSFEGQGVNCS